MKWNYTAAWVIGSSVATDGTRVYAGCWDGNIYCIDASTGCKLWSYQTGDGPQSASPAIANGSIYVSGHGSSYWFTNETIPTTLYALGEDASCIPEFPAFTIMPVTALMIVVVLLAAVWEAFFCRRRQSVRLRGGH